MFNLDRTISSPEMDSVEHRPFGEDVPAAAASFDWSALDTLADAAASH